MTTRAEMTDQDQQMQDQWGFGLAIRSTLPVPGAIPPQASAPAHAPLDAPLTITLADAHKRAPENAPEWWDGDAVQISYGAPAVADFRCTANHIEVAARDGADHVLLSRLLIANALPAVLWLRGVYVLHAAAVRLPGAARLWAICGPSGIGKSTMARQLVDQGAALAADDVLAIDVAADSDADKAISGSGLPGGVWCSAASERLFDPIPFGQQLAHGPLGGVILLQRGDAGSPAALAPLSSSAAIEALLANRHRAHVPAMIGQRAHVFAQAAQMTRIVPVYQWRRADGDVHLSDDEWDQLLAIMT